MTIYSARLKQETFGGPDGYCFPLTLDAMLRWTDLPDRYYDLFHADQIGNTGYNAAVSTLLLDFFDVKPKPATDTAAVAKYTAFGASPQTYCHNAPYNYANQFRQLQEHGATTAQLRMRRVLANARANDCKILFTSFSEVGEHVSGLDMIDPETHPALAKYVIWESADGIRIPSDKIYNRDELNGIDKLYGLYSDEYAPLPEISRPYFPECQTSWELVILPPEPR